MSVNARYKENYVQSAFKSAREHDLGKYFI